MPRSINHSSLQDFTWKQSAFAAIKYHYSISRIIRILSTKKSVKKNYDYENGMLIESSNEKTGRRQT